MVRITLPDATEVTSVAANVDTGSIRRGSAELLEKVRHYSAGRNIDQRKRAIAKQAGRQQLRVFQLFSLHGFDGKTPQSRQGADVS